MSRWICFVFKKRKGRRGLKNSYKVPSNLGLRKSKSEPGMAAHASDPGAEARGLLQVQNQTCLHSKFQTSQGHRKTPRLKNK